MTSMSIEVAVPETALFRGEGAQVVEREELAATEYGVNLVLGSIVPLTPINLGILRGGVQSDIHGTPVEGIHGRIFDPVTYALPMETGTKAFMPPSSALIPWVIRKLGIDEKKAAGVAFVIARSIRRKGGLAPREFFKRGWEMSKGQVVARFDQALIAIREALGR